MADHETKPQEIPLGGSAQVLGELYATAEGAKMAASAAVGAANQANQRFQDAALMFRKTHAVPDAAKVNFEFTRGVLVVTNEPA